MTVRKDGHMIAEQRQERDRRTGLQSNEFTSRLAVIKKTIVFEGTRLPSGDTPSCSKISHLFSRNVYVGFYVG